MKFNFKKIAPICAGAILLGSTIGFAGALAADTVSYPKSFSNSVIVVGDSATADDSPANLISTNLGISSGVSITGPSVTEDEVILGADVAIGKLAGTLDDADISSLLDEQISWDDGGGDDDYDIHEEIILGTGLDIKTSVDDNDYMEPAMTVNEAGITYKYVFEDGINVTAIDSDNTLKLKILGKTIEFSNIDLTAATGTVTINLAPEVSLKEGETYSVDGKTVTVVDIYDGSVSVTVDGVSEIIDKDETDTVNGVKIKVTSVGYSDTVGKSKAIMKIGDEITKAYDNGDAYIGEDEDDPTWEWVITNSTACAAGTSATCKPELGVQYSDKMEKIVPADEPVTAGGSYTLPNNFATVKFVGVNDISSEDVKISFDTSENLYSLADPGVKTVAGGKVVIIEGADDESIYINSTLETEKIALYYNNSGTGYNESNAGQDLVQLYAWDTEDDEFEYFKTVSAIVGAANANVANITNEDTIIKIGITCATNVSNMNITLDNNDADGSDIIVNVQGSNALEYLGATDDQGDSADVYVGTVASGTKDNDVMDHYGSVLKTPEANSDRDIVEITIPSEQIYAEATVIGAAEVSEGKTLVVKASTVNVGSTSKDLIVVGGSAVNSVAATLLGLTSPTYGDAWTAATGVGADMAMIKLFSGATDGLPTGKIALLVAGYEAKDTEAAAKYLIAEKGIDKKLNTAVSTAVTATSL